MKKKHNPSQEKRGVDLESEDNFERTNVQPVQKMHSEIPIGGNAESVITSPRPVENIQEKEQKTAHFSSSHDLESPDPTEVYAAAAETLASEIVEGVESEVQAVSGELIATTSGAVKEGGNIVSRFNRWREHQQEWWRNWHEKMDESEQEQDEAQKELDKKLPTMSWWDRMMTSMELSLSSGKEELQRALIQNGMLIGALAGIALFVSSLVAAPLATLSGLAWVTGGVLFTLGAFDALYVISHAPKVVDPPLLTRLARWNARIVRRAQEKKNGEQEKAKKDKNTKISL